MNNIKAFTRSLIFLLLLSGCTKVYHPTRSTASYSSINPTDYPAIDTATDNIIKPYREKLETEMNRVIGHFEITMKKEKPESLLGNMLADAVYELSDSLYKTGKLDGALLNFGGIRLPEVVRGPFNYGTLFQLLPFENNIVILSLKGYKLKDLLDKIAENGGWPVSKQIRFRIENKIARDILIDGKPLELDKIYQIAMPDYVANGGDNCEMICQEPRVAIDLLLRDALYQYIMKKEAAGIQITASLDGRIK